MRKEEEAEMIVNRVFWRSVCFQNPHIAFACNMEARGGLWLCFRNPEKCIEFWPMSRGVVWVDFVWGKDEWPSKRARPGKGVAPVNPLLC